MFKYIDRGYKASIVLIPGWATDYRIFDFLDLKFNYLLPVRFAPFDFSKSLLREIKKRTIKKISLLGLSLGGFLAAEFAFKHPGLIDELILISIRKRYKENDLSHIKGQLKKNKKAYLYKFYSLCFPGRKHIDDSAKKLFNRYYNTMDLDYLLYGLQYLEKAKIEPALLGKIENIRIIHGEYDNIAPIQEAFDIKSRLPKAKFICVKDAGHFPFLKADFKKYYDG